MKQLFIKEWREHFKAALLALATLSLLLILVVWNDLVKSVVLADTNSSLSAEMLQPLVSSDVLGISSFFCAIFGLLLGWLQIQAEKHPDLRAFLLHRPVERTTIFWSKVLSGGALYAFGAGVPLAGLVIYVLIPGHIPAPFEWAMVQPLTNVFLLGLVFYAAGLLTAVRPVRWYGSRVFGLGLAFLASYALFKWPDFLRALATIVLAGAILVAAVWGAFLAGGTWREQPGPGKLALSFACTVAGLLLCLLAAVLLMEFLFRPFVNTPNSFYQFSRDGVVYRVNPGAVTIEDLDGRILRDEKTGQNLSEEDFYKTMSVHVSTAVNFQRPRPEDQLGGWRWYCSSTRYFIPWQRTDKTVWYLTRAGRFAAYDLATRRRVDDQELGAGSGVHFNWPEDFYQNAIFNSFSTDPRQPRLLTSGQTLYRVDGADRTVKTLLAAANEGGLGGYAESADQQVLVVTRKFVRLMNLQGGVEFQTSYDAVLPDYPQITLSRLDAANEFALLFNPGYGLSPKLPVEVEWVQDGQILRQQKLPPLPVPGVDPYNRRVEECCLLVIPTSLRVGVEEFFHVYYKQAYHFDRWDACSLIPVGFSLLIGWGLGRRLRLTFREQAAWAAFNLIFGVGGVLAFLSVQEWPTRERCPQCQKLRRVDREHCEHCGGGFAPPARNGTEIFAPAPARPV
jgi:hypothetical protein